MADLPRERSTTDDAEQAARFVLYASEQSPCAGQKYILTSAKGTPILSSRDDSSRVTIDYELDQQALADEQSDEKQSDELVCEAGQLELQSLARGR